MCDSIWSHYHHLERSLRMLRLTWPITGGGGKNYPHFWNPWLKFTYSLCHFQGATTKIKLCYMRKIAFIPLWRLQSSLRMRSITWPVHRGSSKTTRNNFLTRLIYSLYNFYGATMTIKGSSYLSTSMLKNFRPQKVQSKSVPKMAFFGNLRVYILIVVIRTPKGTSLAGTTSFGVFFVKIRLGV